MKENYFFHLYSSYFLTIVNIIIPILLTPYMVGKLGGEYYGLWVLLNSIIGYFGLSNLGMGTTLLKEVSQNENTTIINKYISTTLGFFFLITIVVSFLFLILILNIDSLFLISKDMLDITRVTFGIMYLIFIINFLFGVFNTLLFAKGMLHIQNFIGVARAILTAILIFFVLYKGYSIVEIALINLLMSIVFSAVILFFTIKYIDFSISYKYFDMAILKSMASPSAHYFLISIAVIVVFYSDNLIISSFIGLSAVAIYSIGYKLVSVAQSLLFKIVDILLPNIASLYGKGKYAEILALHNKVLSYSMLLAIPGYTILYFFGTYIIELWVGKEFTISDNILKVFVLFALIHTWVHVSAIFVAAMGIHKETSYMAIIEAVLNIVLSLVLLQYYGLLGIAMGTLFAHVLTNGWFVSFWFYKNIIKQRDKEKIIEKRY